MSEGIEGVTICEMCHGPVAYLDTRDELQAFCADCARSQSALEAGQVRAALTSLHIVVKLAGDAGASLDEIIALVRDAYSEKMLDEMPEASFPNWASGRFEVDTRFVPLTGGGEATR